MSFDNPTPEELAAIRAAAENHFAVRSVLSRLTPAMAVGASKIRVGRDFDGGYIMLDRFPQDMICYSLGISGDVSWDLAMAERGGQIYQYDHTIGQLPSTHPKFHFFPVGIGPSTSTDPKLKSLASLIEANGHSQKKGMILKMDIEDSEWNVFDDMSEETLGQFGQIVLELHGLSRMAEHDWRVWFDRILSKLRRTHVPIYVHGNNWAQLPIVHGVPVPDCLEVSYANRNDFTFKPNTNIFPTTLDHPCKPGDPDYFLGNFAFDFEAPPYGRAYWPRMETQDAATLAKLLVKRIKKAFLAEEF